MNIFKWELKKILLLPKKKLEITLFAMALLKPFTTGRKDIYT